MKTFNNIFIILFLFTFSIGVNAQVHEVPTGPFGDSTNYVPPPLFLHKTNDTTNITHYMQFGQSWSSNKLGTCNELISNLGCAMTDAAILLKANGVNVDPGQLNTWLTNNCGYADNSGTICLDCNIRWIIVAKYPGATLTWYRSDTYTLSTLKSEILGGNPVIVHVDRAYGSTSTNTCNHFVVVYGYNNDGTSSSDFLVSDPGTSTFPTYLSSYSICTSDKGNAPLRLYHNVTLTGSGPTDVTDSNISSIPNFFSISQNYPNPFNPNTTIKYSIPRASNVNINIYDILGREIVTLINEVKSVGTYTAIFNAANMPSGVYFYRLRAGDFIATKKLILLK